MCDFCKREDGPVACKITLCLMDTRMAIENTPGATNPEYKFCSYRCGAQFLDQRRFELQQREGFSQIAG